METNISLPHKAVYLKKAMKYNSFGKKVFYYFPYEVMVVEDTEKSYKIRFKTGEDEFEGRETFVRKDSIKFNFLTKENYCEKRGKYIPDSFCMICYQSCALRGKDFPKAVITNI